MSESDGRVTPMEVPAHSAPFVMERSAAAVAPSVVEEHAVHGGIKWGSAFFGWLTAMGLAAVLTALAVAAGAAVGLDANGSRTAVGDAVANADAGTIGTVGAIAVLLVMLVAYLAGGYVAGRMARFDGARQGLAVWLWAVVIALLVGVVAAVSGSAYDVFARLDVFPRVPASGQTVTTVGVVALVIAALVSLVGAVLGGILGMRFHRRVDATGIAAAADADGRPVATHVR